MKSLQAVGSAGENSEGAGAGCPSSLLSAAVLSACEKWLMLPNPTEMHGWH